MNTFETKYMYQNKWTKLSEDLVCIILVNYNGYEDTKECVESILECHYSNYKIIIVDNASKDTHALKNDSFLNEHCEIIYSPNNDGFSEGNNIGIQAAEKYDPKYVLLLNNDTVVLPDFLNELVMAAQSEPNVAITTSIINYYYNKDKSWYNYGNYNRALGYTTMVTSNDKIPNKPFPISFSTGCFMLISYEFIKNCGMLSNDYFLYSEDTEYCMRAIKGGYKMLCVPKVLIYHKVNASTGTGSKMQQYYLVRNYLIVAKEYGTCFPLAYFFRKALSLYEVIRYHYDMSVVHLAFQDFKKGIKGKVGYFDNI